MELRRPAGRGIPASTPRAVVGIGEAARGCGERLGAGRWPILRAMKIRTLAWAALCAAPILCPAAPSDPNPRISAIVSEISPARIESTIRTLAAFGTRDSLSDTASDTRGIGAARRWIKARLDECASASGGRLQVAFDPHHVESGPRIPRPTDIVNVVATLPGEQPESRARIYVVSGHYDSMPTNPSDGESDAPGANDDASGTAVSMELACVMSRHRFDATLVFMAVAGEEQGLYGSTGFAKDARAKGLDIQGMITNDIVGNTKSAEGAIDQGRVRLFAQGVPASKEISDDVLGALRTGGENDLPTRQLARAIAAAARTYVPGLRVQTIWRRDRFLRGGDHFPFLAEGYPAVRFTEPVENWNHQHQNVRVENGIQYGDLAEFVDFGYVAQVARRERHDPFLGAQCGARRRRLPGRLARDHGAGLGAREGRGQRHARDAPRLEGRLRVRNRGLRPRGERLARRVSAAAPPAAPAGGQVGAGLTARAR
jgi:peptidase M28-like protein